MSKHTGRPRDELRDKYRQRYPMSDKQYVIYLSMAAVAQLQLCKDEMAVRLLLGKSEQFSAEEMEALATQ